MTEQPRIRDLYQEYLEGRIPFEDLVEVANRFLERYEAERTADEAAAVESPEGTPGT